MKKHGTARAAITLLIMMAVTLGLAPPASAAPGDSPSADDMESFFDEHVTDHVENDAIPGAAVTVVAGGEQVFSKGYGMANVEDEEPVDAEQTGFFTGSVSKMFISHAAMQQVEAGDLDLDADVNEYLDFEIADTYPGEPVTLRHLLTHTAGFDEDMVGVATTDPHEAPELGAFLVDNQPPRVREPGTVVSYDNYGTELAAYLVERVSGQEFGDYVDEHLFEPLGMSGTTMQVPHPDDITANLATLYKQDGRTVQDPLFSGMNSAGIGPVTNGADMAKWMNWQLAEEPSFDAEIVREIQQIQYRQEDEVPGGMGFLFEEYERGGVSMVNKGGDINGSHTMTSLLPEHNVGVFVSFNGDGFAGKAAAATSSLVNGFVDEFFAEQEKLSSVDADASQYEGYYGQSRTSQSSLSRVGELFSAPVSVTANDDGSLNITGLGPGDERWEQIEPGLFAQQEDDKSAIYLGFDDRGNLVSSQAPIMTFVPLSWYEHPLLYQILIAVGLLALLAAAITFPIIALVRKVGKRDPHPRGAKLARALAVVMGPVAIVAVCGYLWVLLFDNVTLLTGSAVLTTAQWLGALLALPAAGIVVLSAASWAKGWWGWFSRLTYSVFALAVLGFMVTMVRYHLTDLPLALS